MDFTLVWFLATTLMLIHQHQGNPIISLSESVFGQSLVLLMDLEVTVGVG